MLFYRNKKAIGIFFVENLPEDNFRMNKSQAFSCKYLKLYYTMTLMPIVLFESLRIMRAVFGEPDFYPALLGYLRGFLVLTLNK